MPSACMRLKILLPFKVFAEKHDVLRIVAESRTGAFGLLPNRRDCAAALVPGILTYETRAEGEVCLAVDEGVLVKTGSEVLVSVRNAIGGLELGELHRAIEREFLDLDEQERSARSVLAKLEGGFIRRFAALDHE
ncbi:MAG: F0F1 ATP synthase subunit epsilon [Proteobacteria bacterium]|nr:F0F1 ATP synthase subunit epsilon [Pseudomonadota bacterium]MBS0554411.1 F0F1 ATP synthase subunit epsilon [Pseudomonadota bacterium]